MKNLLASLLLAHAVMSEASAAKKLPPCWPKQIGSTGSSFKTGVTNDGRWVAWTCTVAEKQQMFGVWAVTDYVIVHPDTTGMSPSKSAAAYWTSNTGPTDSAELLRLRAAAQRAFTP